MSQLSLWNEPVNPKSTDHNTAMPYAARIDALPIAGKGHSNGSVKCLAAADSLQKLIDAKHRSANNRLLRVPTRKRLTDAASSRREAIRLEQIQTTLRRLAAMHQNAIIPSELAGLASRGAIESALFTSQNDSAIRALYNSVARDERKAERILRMTQEALLQKLPGYFPNSRSARRATY